MSGTGSGINFKGVAEAQEKTMTRAGVIDVFTISDVKFDSTKNKGTYYCGVKFERKNDSFSHSFFLSEKAVGRLKSLIKAATGKELEEEVYEDQISKMLLGAKVALKVTGKIDTENGRAYPDLSFGGFAKPAEKIGDLSFSDQENDKNKEAEKVYAKGRTSEADGPDTSSKEKPAAGAGGATKDEDIF